MEQIKYICEILKNPTITENKPVEAGVVDGYLAMEVCAWCYCN